MKNRGRMNTDKPNSSSMPDRRFGFVDALPKNMQIPFQELCNDIVRLTDKWGLYKQLFGQQETVEILNATAPYAFFMIQEALRADVILSIFRLCDPSCSARRNKNLTLQTLVEMGKSSPKQELIKDLELRVHAFRELCEPVIKYRHKRFGHNDYNVAIHARGDLLPKIPHALIDKIILEAAAFMNTCVQYFRDLELGFEAIHLGGGDDLLFWLRKGWGNRDPMHSMEYEEKE